MLKQNYFLKISLLLLLIIGNLTSCTKDNKKRTSFADYQSYIDDVENNIQSLTDDKKLSRQNMIDQLQATQTYKMLVDSSIVSTEYLPLFSAINDGLRNTAIRNNDEILAFNQHFEKRVKNATNGKDKFKFVIAASVLSTPNKGGYTKELVEVFERYRKKFGLYGMPSKMYSLENEVMNEIKNPYNFTAIFYHINPSNKNLNAVYEATKKGAGEWFKDIKGQDYVFKHLATKQGYLDYVKKVNPNSPYILKVDYEVTANQLYNAYNSNEIAADDKYKGKKVAVTGKISDISEVFGAINVDLKTGDGIGWTKVSCTMKNRDIVSKLRKGQKITIIGTCEGLTLNVSIDLEDCNIL
ncbi:MAG: OB-fold protein [Oceanihabitans sp.]